MRMKDQIFSKRNAQLIVVLVSAAAVKFYYSTASVNQLRWILAPTTFLVELVSGRRFEFESNAGYMSSDHTFLIAASCAGVNFLITSFLMLSLARLWRDRASHTEWIFMPVAAGLAYLTTVVANTARIAIALHLQQTPVDVKWLSGHQLHRLEGIIVYFGFLLLLYVVTEQKWMTDASLVRRLLFPLLVYYAITLGVPLLNGAYRQGSDFLEHILFVVLTPLVVIIPLATLQLVVRRQVKTSADREGVKAKLTPLTINAAISNYDMSDKSACSPDFR